MGTIKPAKATLYVFSLTTLRTERKTPPPPPPPTSTTTTTSNARGVLRRRSTGSRTPRRRRLWWFAHDAHDRPPKWTPQNRSRRSVAFGNVQPAQHVYKMRDEKTGYLQTF